LVLVQRLLLRSELDVCVMGVRSILTMPM